METYEIKQGDMTKLQFTILRKSTKTPFDLTGTTCTLVIAGGNVYSKITKACTVNDPVNGKCYYELMPDDTNTLIGLYQLEVKIDGSKDYTTLDEATLIVKRML